MKQGRSPAPKAWQVPQRLGSCNSSSSQEVLASTAPHWCLFLKALQQAGWGRVLKALSSAGSQGGTQGSSQAAASHDAPSHASLPCSSCSTSASASSAALPPPAGAAARAS